MSRAQNSETFRSRTHLAEFIRESDHCKFDEAEEYKRHADEEPEVYRLKICRLEKNTIFIAALFVIIFPYDCQAFVCSDNYTLIVDLAEYDRQFARLFSILFVFAGLVKNLYRRSSTHLSPSSFPLPPFSSSMQKNFLKITLCIDCRAIVTDFLRSMHNTCSLLSDFHCAKQSFFS